MGGCGAMVRSTEAEEVRWLLEYRGPGLPQEQGWTPSGELAVKAQVVDGALRIVDDAADDMGAYRATWKADSGDEIIVEARVRVVSLRGYRGGPLLWPWLDGAPAHILVSDGAHQEGLVLCPGRISTFTDRFVPMDTTRAFHVYRLVIRGTDMSVQVDGQPRIRGQDAFWKPAESSTPFVQFGSNSKPFVGEAHWEYVKLGVRKAQVAPERPKLKITVSEPWDVVAKIQHSRPSLYNMGAGLLLLCVAQGPDKFYEPYGVLKSTDEGRTWTPLEDLQLKTFAPEPMVRLADGGILGVSRFTVKYDDGVYVGMSYRFDPKAESFTMFENRISAPKETAPMMGFDRHIFEVEPGVILAVVNDTERHAYLMKTTDGGRTWTHFSTIGTGHEPSVVRLSATEMTALLRQGGMTPFHQVWSQDGGKTWGAPTVLEEGSVDADLVVMTNGVLPCSYGRPASCLMFSTDKGKTWAHHRVISVQRGYNYTSLQEVRPGRLLYLHDAPKMQAVYVDVERGADGADDVSVHHGFGPVRAGALVGVEGQRRDVERARADSRSGTPKAARRHGGWRMRRGDGVSSQDRHGAGHGA